MATASRAHRTRPADTCRLTLHIRGVAYAVHPLATQDEDVAKAYTLRKSDGASYVVADTVYGATCDCGDQTWRHEGRGPTACKHIRAARAVGLLAGDVARPGAETWPAWTDSQRYTV